eukprot:gene16394-16572_t
MRKLILGFAFVLALNSGARADDLKPLPSLAQSAQPSPWAGLYYGTDAFGTFAKHSKGQIGGDGFIGYDHKLANDWTIGVVASAGYVPYSFANSPLKGVDFATTQVKLGYDLGRLKPYVTAGVALAKPTAINSGSNDALNNLFAGSGGLKADR